MSRKGALRLSTILLFTAAAFAADQAKLPEGEGRKLVEAACTACHALDLLTSKRLSAKDWHAVIDAMITRGASLTDAETATVVQYLAGHFGANEKVRDQGQALFEDLCSSCHPLNKVAVQDLNREEWHELVTGMLVEGNAATPEEISLIAEYLADTYPPTAERKTR